MLGVGGVFAAARGAVPTGGTDHQNLTWENGAPRWRSPITLDTLQRVTKIPTAFSESLLYLTHDEIDNTTSADNADLVPGVNDRAGGDFFGWTRGHNGIPATGTLTPHYIPVEMIGTSQGTFTGTGADRVVTGWGVEFIGSRNRDFGEAWPVIVHRRHIVQSRWAGLVEQLRAVAVRHQQRADRAGGREDNQLLVGGIERSVYAVERHGCHSQSWSVGVERRGV